VIECIPSGPLAGEFDILPLWLRIVIVKPLSDLLDEILVGGAQDVIHLKTYLAGFCLIERYRRRSEST